MQSVDIRHGSVAAKLLGSFILSVDLAVSVDESLKFQVRKLHDALSEY